MATKSKRIRDFKQEYLARIARGLASGKSRSQARGHARASDLPHASPLPFEKENRLEKALKLMKQGATQKQAAKAAGVSAETLRRFHHAGPDQYAPRVDAASDGGTSCPASRTRSNPFPRF